MDASHEGRFLRGVGITSLGTLVSRVLGLARDIVTASLLGLGQGGVMDALVIALRIPNFSRRVLGEGALAASFLPVFAREHERHAAPDHQPRTHDFHPVWGTRGQDKGQDALHGRTLAP